MSAATPKLTKVEQQLYDVHHTDAYVGRVGFHRGSSRWMAQVPDGDALRTWKHFGTRAGAVAGLLSYADEQARLPRVDAGPPAGAVRPLVGHLRRVVNGAAQYHRVDGQWWPNGALELWRAGHHATAHASNEVKVWEALRWQVPGCTVDVEWLPEQPLPTGEDDTDG